MKYFSIFSTAEDMASKFVDHKYYVKDYYSSQREVVKSDIDTKITYLGDIYKIDFKQMWEDHYVDLTFGQFKRAFYRGELIGFELSNEFLPEYLLNVTSNFENLGIACDNIISILDQVDKSLSTMSLYNKFISVDEMADLLKSTDCCHLNKDEYLVASENLIQLINRYKNKKSFGYNEIFKYHSDTNKYSITSMNSLKTKLMRLKNDIKNKFESTRKALNRVFLINSIDTSRVSDSVEMIIAQMMEIFKLAHYEIVSGEIPEYFIRINSINEIDRVINDANYKSEMVKLVSDRHYESMNIMNKFFIELKGDQERWNFIEQYFAGVDYDQ